MKFSINQSEFYQAMSVVSKGAAAHSTLPILAGVYIDASEDHVVLQTTDLDRSVQYTVPALVEEEGSIVVPAKLLTDITKSLPDAAVHFEANQNDAVIMWMPSISRDSPLSMLSTQLRFRFRNSHPW